jgi:hypothetical protein
MRAGKSSIGGPYPQREDRKAFLVRPAHETVPTFD